MVLNRGLMRRWSSRAVLVCILAGCAAPATDAVLDAARSAAGEGDWAATLDLAKRYTYDHPDDSAGHYLLGQAYFYGAMPNLTQARGELHMAIELFRKQQRWGVFQREGMPADDYELAVRKELARVHLRWILKAMDHRIPPGPILEHVAECRQQIERGRVLAPEDTQFEALASDLDDLESMLTRPPQSVAQSTTAAA